MRRVFISIVVALSVIVAACGDGGSAPSATGESGEETAAPATEAGSVSSQTTANEAPTTTDPAMPATTASGETVAPSGVEGPQAPDFEFQLDDGSTFVLSEEAKPVYMVFWAEW